MHNNNNIKAIIRKQLKTNYRVDKALLFDGRSIKQDRFEVVGANLRLTFAQGFDSK